VVSGAGEVIAQQADVLVLGIVWKERITEDRSGTIQSG
jgi:hypothetical protein